MHVPEFQLADTRHHEMSNGRLKTIRLYNRGIEQRRLLHMKYTLVALEG